MKQFLLILSLLLLTLLPQTANAVKKIEANPINIAAQLVEKTDSAKIVSTLDYYGYILQHTEDGYQVMHGPNGNEIRFTFTEKGSRSKYPIIIVKTNGTSKSIGSRLKELNFDKKGRVYEKMRNPYSRYKTQCSFGSHGIIIFRRIKN